MIIMLTSLLQEPIGSPSFDEMARASVFHVEAVPPSVVPVLFLHVPEKVPSTKV